MSEKTMNKGFKGMMAIILSGLIVIMLNQSIINIALPQIMNQFKITASTAQWLSTAYMLVMGILVPVSAFLVQRFSYKQLFITAMAFFTAGSFICAVSTGFGILLVGRIIQATGGGILMPLSMNIFMSAFPVEKRGSAMGLLGFGMIFAPALGPSISGYIIEYYNWNVLFYAMSAISFCVLIAAFPLLNYKKERGNAKLDIFGTIASIIGFGTLLFGISNISSKGWNDPEVITLLIISVISLTIFIFYSLKKEEPLLELSVFKDFNFSYTIILNIILQVTLYGGMLLLPIYLQLIRGFSSLEAGILLLPGSLLIGIFGIVTGKLYDKFGIKPLAIFGMTIITGATYMLSTLSMDTSYTEIMILYTLRSFGMAFVMMPITTAAIATIPQKLIPHANALFSTSSQIAASIGTALLVVVMSDQAKNYIHDLGKAATVDSDKLASLHGISVALFVSTIISAIALVMSLFLKKAMVEQ